LAKRAKTYSDIERHRKKGKPGDDLTDAAVPGLYYHKQGNQVYARLRAMGKVAGKPTGKREDHWWSEPLPSEKELMEHLHGGPVSFREPEHNAEQWLAWLHDLHVRANEAEEQFLEQIREWARRKRREVKGGPVSVLDKPSAAVLPTVAELVAKYEAIAYPKLRAKTVSNHHSYLRRFIMPAFGSRTVASITRHEVEELHGSLAPTPYQANRVLSLLSTIFGKAVEWDCRPDNPAKGIKHFHEHGREDAYDEEDLAKLIAALETFAAGDDKARKISARAILLTLLTGARPGEVLSATWDMFDLEAGTWTKPSSHVKQRRIHHLALNEDALELLRTMRDELGAKATGYLFPSPFVPGQHLKDPGRTWERAVEVACVRRFPLYTLRHSQGSVLANAGVDLYTVGKQLGHAQVKTTARYAHLGVETQRKATDKFSELVKAKRE
jgi:integrase